MEIHINIDKLNISQSMEEKINCLVRCEAWNGLKMNTENKSDNRYVFAGGQSFSALTKLALLNPRQVS